MTYQSEDLRRRAEAAGGRYAVWSWDTWEDGSGCVAGSMDAWTVATVEPSPPEIGRTDPRPIVEFIASVDPRTVLDLIDDLGALQALLRRLLDNEPFDSFVWLEGDRLVVDSSLNLSPDELALVVALTPPSTTEETQP